VGGVATSKSLTDRQAATACAPLARSVAPSASYLQRYLHRRLQRYLQRSL